MYKLNDRYLIIDSIEKKTSPQQKQQESGYSEKRQCKGLWWMCTNIQGGHLLGAVDSDDLNLPDEILDGLNGFWIYVSKEDEWMND